MSFSLDELTQFVIFAQENGEGEGATPPGGLFDPFFLILIVGVMVMFYLMVARPQRQKQKEAQKMLENLKENDEVVTIGGIVGSIVSFTKDGTEVVLRTDEKSNTKLRILRSHISRPLKVEDQAESQPQDLKEGSA